VSSNKLFTLTTLPDHLEPGDSSELGSPVALVTPHSRHKPQTPDVVAALLALIVGALVVLSLAGTAAAAPASKCGEKVLADWFDNGRIDRLYPLHCYEEAIDAIPPDLRDYADAEEIISRALQSALRGELAPGGADPTPGDDSPDGRNPGGPAGPGGGSGSSGGSEATPDVDTSAPSSVPIPLIVLGGMSLILLAAGGLGYVSRRRQAASGPDDHDDPPLD
jgi:hypothetical protein